MCWVGLSPRPEFETDRVEGNTQVMGPGYTRGLVRRSIKEQSYPKKETCVLTFSKLIRVVFQGHGAIRERNAIRHRSL